ncbi:hypothetical protein SFA35_20665 [Pseudomonas sp. HR96]|uniref:hypothetical protein n=1 Tax=Pseudomonas sp. HR96 TaxID=1027966 RepID=UPI002A76514A|nr:hypothetical protein [Pseudomonas sp. HR96]WPO99000.1 hypothetical protein SFA35_20665 [Pseudomonas sp. HR96]
MAEQRVTSAASTPQVSDTFRSTVASKPVITGVWSAADPSQAIGSGDISHDRNAVFEGTANPGATVFLRYNGTFHSITADADGVWRITLPLNDGRNQITVSSEGQTADPYTINHYPPADPRAEITYVGAPNPFDAFIQVHGVAAPWAPVTVWVNGTQYQVTARHDGKWHANVTLEPGTNQITASSEGQTSSEHVVDYTPPAIPAPEITHFSDWSAIEPGVGQVQGTAAPWAQVTVMVNGTEYLVTARHDGKWHVKVTLEAGSNQITASADGQTSEPYLVDYTPPAIPAPEITHFSEWSAIEPGAGQVQGTATPWAQVTVMVNGTEYLVTARHDGKWHVKVTLEAGSNQITASADGQTSEPYLVDYTPPAIPAPEITHFSEWSAIEPGAGQVQGTATPWAQVTVMVNGTEYLVTARHDGKWYVKVTLEAGSNQITASADGQTSEPYLVDYTPPAIPAPEITHFSEWSAIEPGAGQVQGTATPWAQVTVMVNGTEYLVTARHDGKWHVKVTLEAGANQITASADGQTSEPYHIDYAPPAAPKPEISHAQDLVGQQARVANGGALDDAEPRVMGSATPGAWVTVLHNGAIVATVQADAYGQWTYRPTLVDGRNELQVVVDGTRSEPFVLTLQDAPTITGIRDEQGALIGNGGEAAGASFTAFGKAQSWAMVEIYLTGSQRPIVVQADGNGDWSQNIPASLGQNTYFVQSGGQWSMGYGFDYILPPAEPNEAGQAGMSDSATELSLEHLLTDPQAPLLAPSSPLPPMVEPVELVLTEADMGEDKAAWQMIDVSTVAIIPSSGFMADDLPGAVVHA